MAEQEKLPNLARCQARNALHRRALPLWRASTLRHLSSTSSSLSTASTAASSASKSSSDPGWCFRACSNIAIFFSAMPAPDALRPPLHAQPCLLH